MIFVCVFLNLSKGGVVKKRFPAFSQPLLMFYHYKTSIDVQELICKKYI